jgi:asparagine synthase (glutamine-hydrolysing)
MSTIFGIFNKNEERVEKKTAERVMATMNHWNADDTGIFIDGSKALGQLMLQNTPESINEKLPLTIENCTITADARIDNRQDIFIQLGNGEKLNQATPDSVLILLLYMKYGQNCVNYLVGDFCFFIYDKKNNFLFCARDHIGVKPFFYYDNNKQFVFASEKKGILAVESVDKSLNNNFILRLIGDAEPDPTETFHKHINILLPGHSIVVSLDSTVIRRYWILEIPPLLKLKKPQDYMEAFQEYMTESVKCRLRSVFPVAAELSGGLDSSGVTGLAAKYIDDINRLHTFSFVLAANEKGIKEAIDEEVFIDEVNRFCGIMNQVKITETGRSHFLDFHEKEIFVNSGIDVYSAYWQEPLRRKMEERGIRVSLSGYLGDEAITHQGKYYFYEFLDEGKYFDFLKSSLQMGYYSLPIKMLMRNLMPEPIKKRINKDHKAVYKRISYLLDTDFEAMLIAEDKKIPIIPTRSYKKNVIDLVTRRYPFQRIQSESLFGIMHRLEPRYPFADIRLLSFFLSVPAHIIGNRHVSRYFYRESMKGLIPELILNRNDKSIPAGIFLGKESRSNSDMIKKWLEGISQDYSNPYLKKIDLAKMLAGLDPLQNSGKNGQFFSTTGSFKIECLVKFFQEL